MQQVLDRVSSPSLSSSICSYRGVRDEISTEEVSIIYQPFFPGKQMCAPKRMSLITAFLPLLLPLPTFYFCSFDCLGVQKPYFMTQLSGSNLSVHQQMNG